VIKKNSFQRGRVEVRKRKKGDVFTILYWVRDPESENGWRLKRETLPNCKSRKDANRTLSERITEINTDNNNPRKKPKVSFAEFAAGLWQDYLHNTEVKPSTEYSYNSMLKNHLDPVFGKVPLADITPHDLTHFFKLLKEEAAPKYALNIYGLLNTMFEVAAQHDLIESIPLRRKLHRPKYQPKEKVVLSADTIRQIIQNVTDEYRPLFVVAASTGLRLGEILALCWRDVDFESRTLYVRHNLWRGKLGSPKTNASKRELHLPQLLADVFLYHRAKSAYTQPGDLVFSKKDGSPFDPDHLRREVLYPTMDALGIEHGNREYGFHIFRHSAGSILHSATGNAKLVQNTLGHSRVSTTLDIYVHVDPKAAEQGTELLTKEIIGDCNLFVTQTSESIS
jgi:integrase